MSLITLKCKNCGAMMSLNTESHSATCTHCGSTFLITDLLDEKDVAFTEKMNPKNFEQKIIARDAIKQGETFLFQAEYEKAEAAFKKAIEYDENNYKGYLGVVKAKTHNLNTLPENDDYIQYANYAISLAEGDDLVVVKSELSKLDLLSREKNRLKKMHAASQKNEEKLRSERRSISKVFTVIAIFILLMFGFFLFISSMFSAAIFKGDGSKKIVNVNSYESLQKVMSNSKFLNYEINLTSDIDCENNSLTPFGTEKKAFSGKFNGNKHTISNLNISSADQKNVGLFGYTLLAQISNVIFDNVTIFESSETTRTTDKSYGILVGKSDVSTIHNIEIKDTCIIDLQGNLDYDTAVGGLAGVVSGGSFISDISSHAKVNTTLSQTTSSAVIYIGGVAGTIENTIFQNTVSNSNINSNISNNFLNQSSVYVGGTAGCILNATAKSVANVTGNFFSGKIDVIAIKSYCSIGGITNNFVGATKKQNNYCLYSSSKFLLNGNRLKADINDQANSLKDISYNSFFTEFIKNNNDYISKLNSSFLGWKNSDSFTPSID